MHNHWNKLVYLGIVMFAGAICGSIFLQALPTAQQEQLNQGMISYVSWLNQSAKLDHSLLFWDTFFKHVKWAVVIILLGVSMIGVPFIVVLSFMKGFLLGSSIYMLIQSLGSEGVWLSIVSIAPHNMMVIPAFIMLSSAALSFASYMFNQRIRKLGGAMTEQVISFSTVAMTMLLVLACAALVEVYVSPQLLKWYVASGI
jgi:stage II sporulation protein M